MMEAEAMKAAIEKLSALPQPWQLALANPAAQAGVRETLLSIYSLTAYGKACGAQGVSSAEDYRKAFPVMTCEAYRPHIQRGMV